MRPSVDIQSRANACVHTEDALADENYGLACTYAVPYANKD